MLEELKRKTLPGKIVEALLFAVIGFAVIFLCADGAKTVPMLLNTTDLYTLDVNELEGRYVKAEIYAIYDWYAETTRGEDTVIRREFIIPVGPEEYMGVNVDKLHFDAAERIMDATQAVLAGDAAELDEKTFTVTGTVMAMDSQTRRFYEQTISYYGLSEAEEELFLPLVIETNRIGDQEKSEVFLWLALGAALIVAGIVVLVLAFTGWYQRKLVAWCKAQPDPQAAKEQLDLFYQSAAQYGKVKVDRELLLYENGGSSFLVPVKEIAWVYQTTTQHRTNGIPTGKTFALTLRTCGKRRESYTIPVKKEEDAFQLMRDLLPYLSRTIFGYNRDWERIYNANPAAFADTILSQRAAAQAAKAAPTSAGPDGSPAASDAADTVSGSYGGSRVP